LTLSELIKSRGIGTQKHTNYNDMIDEVYYKERSQTRINLKELLPIIKDNPHLFEISFKRSLLNHLNERKRIYEEEIENKLRK
jgi:hypothetical protein